MIDLRSDTVTKPTLGMLAAMSHAKVGDDVIDIDPTTRLLEETIADALGKEDAIFMPSGTMTNQIGIRSHCAPGDEFLCEYDCHIFTYEQGGFAQLSQLVAHTVSGDECLLSVDHLRNRIRPDNDHFVRTKLVCLENTHNRGGGRVHPLNQVNEICDWAHSQHLKTHLDGARLFNAAIATGIGEREWCSGFDSISVCFSKGLGAPVGSCLLGTKDYTRRAKRARKLFGGGMRQSGFLAAAALYGFQHQRDRLAEDHANARLLADCIRSLEKLSLGCKQVDTNIVIVNLDQSLGTAAAFVQKLALQGVAALPFGPQSIRLVTHLDVGRQDILNACQILSDAASDKF
jgi:threonine aldolase